MKSKIDVKSLILGAALAVIAFCSAGAATHQPFVSTFMPVRFRVLELTRHGEALNGKQTIVLRLAPHYGKIDTKSYEFRSKHETQNLTLVTAIDPNYDLRTNDIVDFNMSQHVKIGR